MSEKPSFDPLKAGFYLVAGVIAVQCFVAVAGVATCIYFGPELVSKKQNCEARDTLANLLTEALAAALAFAGGYMRNKDK